MDAHGQSIRVKSIKSPRGIRVDAGTQFSGIDITAYRTGVYVGAFYDSMVGVGGLWLSWQDIERLRVLANATHKSAESIMFGTPWSWLETQEPRPPGRKE